MLPRPPSPPPPSQATNFRAHWLFRLCSRAFLEFFILSRPLTSDGNFAKCEAALSLLSLSNHLSLATTNRLSDILETADHRSFVRYQTSVLQARLTAATNLLSAAKISVLPPSLLKVDLSWQAARAVTADLRECFKVLRGLRRQSLPTELQLEMTRVSKMAEELREALRKSRGPLRERFKTWRRALRELRTEASKKEPKEVRNRTITLAQMLQKLHRNLMRNRMLLAEI